MLSSDTLFWTLVTLAGFAGLVSLRLKHKIRNRAVRKAMLTFGALALFAIAGQELYRLTKAFSHWQSLASVGGLVPAGWFLAGCFILFVFVRGDWGSPEQPSEMKSGGGT